MAASTWDMDNPNYDNVPFSIIYRASALGYCTKAQAAKRLGMRQLPWPAMFLAKFKRGHEIEEEVIADLRAGGYVVVSQQSQVILSVTSTIAIVGHLDGTFRHEDPNLVTANRWRLLEVKSMGASSFNNFQGWDTPGLFQKYKWQLSALMLATDLPATVIVREDPELDRTNLALPKPRQRSLEVDKPFYSLSDIRARILEIERLVISGLPEVCEQADWPCPVAYLHPERNEPQDEAVAALVADLRAAREAKKEAEKEVEVRGRNERDVKDRLVAAMGENGRMEGATKYEQAGPGSYDWDKMKEDGIEVEKYKKKGNKTWRVRLAKEEE